MSAAVTTEWGAPAASMTTSASAGKDGPLLLSDTTLVSKLAHFDRERIPERVVHAKGAGAFGYFEATHDVSDVCKAAFLRKGERTPVLARFSTVGGEKGSSDAARDPRGFAVKFYTTEGNYDFVGNNTPVFFIRDPMRFPDFIHTQKRDPATNLLCPRMFWDFLSTTPESLHQVLILFSDRGTPATYRHMNGYSSHTFRWVNAAGVGHWVKLHFKPEVGVASMTADEATAKTAKDADHATRDLYETIEAGGEAAWRLFVQVMPEKDAACYKYNPFDITKVWPHGDYPLRHVGRLVLNKNPSNYFAEIEQAAFSPGHLVPGIEASPDKMLQARLFSYPDTHRHRLGANYHHLPVNCPFAAVRTHQRDGPMCIYAGGSETSYFTGVKSSGGAQTVTSAAADAPLKVTGVTGRFDATPADPDADFVQPRALYERVMTVAERDRLTSNIAGHLHKAPLDIRERQMALFDRVSKDLGATVRRKVAAEAAAAAVAVAAAAAAVVVGGAGTA